MIRMLDVPPSYRWVEAITVGLLFAEPQSLQCHTYEWADTISMAQWLASKSDRFVAFRRFVYNPGFCKEYMDPGWVYFKGTKISKKDILSGRAEKMYPGIEISDILKSNVKHNRFDLIWFSDSNKFYLFEENNSFVRL